MAVSARPVTGGSFADPDRRWKLGLALAAFAALALFVGLAFAALIGASARLPAPLSILGDPYVRGIAVFTLVQAGLAALLSAGTGVVLGIALHRSRFRGRDVLMRLFLLPQVLPVLVGVLGIVVVFGRNGFLSDAAAAVGLPRFDIYGLGGILIAYVFFNMPLVTRLVVAALDQVPAESWKLAASLQLPPSAVFRLVEWPAIRRMLPGAMSLVFMICITSFTIVLVLGGGPGATTLDVAIYQALRYDFDPERAVVLALLQIALTAAVLAATFRLGGNLSVQATLAAKVRRFEAATTFERMWRRAAIAAGLGFIALPFLAVITGGLGSDLWRLLGEGAVQRAALTTAAVAVAAAGLSLALSLSLAFGIEALRGLGGKRVRGVHGLFALAGSIVLVVPPIVIGAGWFMALRGFTDVFAAAPMMVIATNAAMATPYVLRIIAPPLADSAERHDRLAASLGLSGLSRLRHVEWPALRAPLGLALAFAAAISVGDLGVAALFGNGDFVTLPLLLHGRMGSYRSTDAAGLALLLGALALGLMLLAEWGTASRRRR